MAGQRGGVRHDDAIAEDAVVSNMGLGHDQAIVTYQSSHPPAGGPPVNRYKFANLVSTADLSLGGLPSIFQILRRQSYRNERKDMCTVPNPGPAFNYAVGIQSNAVT
jgi:hypothetical protein